RQLAGQRRLMPGDGPDRFLMKRENPLGEVVQPPARLGHQQMSALAFEQRRLQRLLERPDSLADRRLRQPQHPRRRREAAELSSFHERLQVRQLVHGRVYFFRCFLTNSTISPVGSATSVLWRTMHSILKASIFSFK